MIDEWEVALLDLDAYLARIGHDGPLAPTEATLTALHRAHVAAIPFENLDVVAGRGVRVDLGSVQDKLVTRRLGGYCYEHGVLFGAALERAGFAVDRLLARVGDETVQVRPRSHLTLRVRAGDREWLADVGFGDGMLAPLPWGGAATQGGWPFEMREHRPGGWQLRQRTGADWEVLYSFTAEPQHFVDVVLANHFTATHPSSPFVRGLVVLRKTADRSRRLIGNTFTVSRPDGTAETRELSDVSAVLRHEFGVTAR